MSLRPKRRKCRCCSEFFFPDYRNQERQHYCDKPACRQASKLASQRRWCRQPANHDYFRDPAHVRRVREWRQAHPGYWKKQARASADAQVTPPQELRSTEPAQSSCNVPRSALGTLQDFCLPEHPGFIGLLSMITGRTLQEDIAPIARRVVEQGQNILGLRLPEQRNLELDLVYDYQTPAPRGSAAANPPKL